MVCTYNASSGQRTAYASCTGPDTWDGIISFSKTGFHFDLDIDSLPAAVVTYDMGVALGVPVSNDITMIED